MSRSHFLALVLACVVCCADNRVACCQQASPLSAPDKKYAEEEFLGKPDPFIANAIKPDPNDSDLLKLQKDLCREQVIALAKMRLLIDTGKINQPADNINFFKLSASLAKDLFEFVEKPADKQKCLEMRVDAFKQLEKFTERRIEIGTDPSQDLNLARAARIEAEIKLLKFKTALKNPDEDLFGKLDPFIANAIKSDPNDSELRKLQKERCRERAIALMKSQVVVAGGQLNSAGFSDLIKLQNSLTENLLELLEKPADKLKCYELRVDFLKLTEKTIAARISVGMELSLYHNIAKAARIDAEIDLLRFKAESERQKK